MSKSSSKLRLETFKAWLDSFKKSNNNTKPIKEFTKHTRRVR